MRVIVRRGRCELSVGAGLGRERDAGDFEFGGPETKPHFIGLPVAPPLAAAELRGIPVATREQQRAAQRRGVAAIFPRLVMHAVREPQRADGGVFRQQLHRTERQRQPLRVIVHIAGKWRIRLEHGDRALLLVFRAKRPRRHGLAEGEAKAANLPGQRRRAPRVRSRTTPKAEQPLEHRDRRCVREWPARLEGDAVGRSKIARAERQARRAALLRAPRASERQPCDAENHPDGFVKLRPASLRARHCFLRHEGRTIPSTMEAGKRGWISSRHRRGRTARKPTPETGMSKPRAHPRVAPERGDVPSQPEWIQLPMPAALPALRSQRAAVLEQIQPIDHLRRGSLSRQCFRTRAVKLGCVGSQTTTAAAGQPLRDHRSTSYVGTLQSVASFAPLLRDEDRRRGSGTAQRMVFIGDGAAWIWELARTHFPVAIPILDFYHLMEYRHELSHLLCGPDTPWAGRRKAHGQAQMEQDEVPAVLDGLNQRVVQLGETAAETVPKGHEKIR